MLRVSVELLSRRCCRWSLWSVSCCLRKDADASLTSVVNCA